MARPPARLAFINSMLPVLVERPPDGGNWIHEVKYDGYRTELVISAGVVRAYTRGGYDWTDRYGPIVEAARALECRSAIIDGEMCVQRPNGVTDFGDLRRAIRLEPERLGLFAFELLRLKGNDLRAEAVIDRPRR